MGFRLTETLQSNPQSFSALLTAGMKAKQLDYRTLSSLAGVSHAYLWQLATSEKRQLSDPSHRPKRPSRALAVKLAEILELDAGQVLQAAGYEPDEAADQDEAAPGIVKYTSFQPAAPALFQRGLDETKRGNPHRGILLLKNAIGQEGVSFLRAHMGLGVAYLMSHQYEAAITEFDKAIAQFPKEGAPLLEGIHLADVYYDRALAQQDSGRHRGAIRDFQAAIRLGGAHADRYYAGLCFSELASGRFVRVIRAAFDYQQLPQEVERYTTAALDIRLYQAYALARRREFEAALSVVSTVIVLCPTYWYAYYVHGAICSRFGAYLETLIARRKGQVRSTMEKRLEQTNYTGQQQSRRALALNQNCRSSFLSERDDDFAYFASRTEFAFLFGDSEVS